MEHLAQEVVLPTPGPSDRHRFLLIHYKESTGYQEGRTSNQSTKRLQGRPQELMITSKKTFILGPSMRASLGRH